MGSITGDRTVDVDAPIERCYELAADLEGAVAWHPMLRKVDVHHRDDAGRPVSATLVTDAKVRTVAGRWQLRYEEFSAIEFEQDRGDVKALTGRWTFSELDPQRTRVTYAMEVDPGRVLGMLMRGPGLLDSVKRHLLEGAVHGLREQAEQP